MKNTISLILCFLSVFQSFSQINIGKSKSPINLYVSSIDKKEFDFLKTTTTYFVVPNQLNYADVQKIIGEIWTFNEIKFIQQEEYDKNENNYISTGNSIIRLVDEVYNKTKTNSAAVRTVAEYISFKFVLYSYLKVDKSKKDKIKKEVLRVAEIFFTPNIKLRSDVIQASSRQSLFIANLFNGKKNIAENNTEEPGFYNFDLGYIKNYFQVLNNHLMKSESLKIRDGILNKAKLKDLKSQILFAPNWILKKYNPMIGNLKEIVEADEIFNKYKFEYKVIPNEELNSKILNGEDFYYLMHTQFNQTKIISIIHSITGEIIYLTEDGSYNINDSDLRHINNLVE